MIDDRLYRLVCVQPMNHMNVSRNDRYVATMPWQDWRRWGEILWQCPTGDPRMDFSNPGTFRPQCMWTYVNIYFQSTKALLPFLWKQPNRIKWEWMFFNILCVRFYFKGQVHSNTLAAPGLPRLSAPHGPASKNCTWQTMPQDGDGSFYHEYLWDLTGPRWFNMKLPSILLVTHQALPIPRCSMPDGPSRAWDPPDLRSRFAEREPQP